MKGLTQIQMISRFYKVRHKIISCCGMTLLKGNSVYKS